MSDFALVHLWYFGQLSLKITMVLLAVHLGCILLRRAGAGGVQSRLAENRPVLLALMMLLGTGFLSGIVMGGDFAIMPDRRTVLQGAIEVWRDFHAPLAHRWNGVLTPGTRGDDAGIYLLTPIFAAQSWNAEEIRRILAFMAAGSLSALWILLVFVTRAAKRPLSVLLVCLPAFATTALLWRRIGDVYWVPGAIAVYGLILLYSESMARGAQRTRIIPWLTFALVAAIACLFRNTSMPIAVAALAGGAAINRGGGATRAAVAVAGVVLVLLLPRLVVAGAEEYRDDNLRSRGVAMDHMPSEHLFWHSIYIGMGVVPNSYGLAYSDSIARNFVGTVNARVAYMSPEYEGILKDRVATIASTDPAFFARQLFVKCIMLLAALAGIIGALPAILRNRGSDAQKHFLLAGGAVVAAAVVPALLVVPLPHYLQGGVSAVILTGALCVVAADLASGAPAPSPTAG